MKLRKVKDVVPRPTTTPMRKIFRKSVSVRLTFSSERKRANRNDRRKVRYLFVGLQIMATCRVRVPLRNVTLGNSLVPRFHARQLINFKAKGNNGNDRRLRNKDKAKGLIHLVTMRKFTSDRIVSQGNRVETYKGFIFCRHVGPHERQLRQDCHLLKPR